MQVAKLLKQAIVICSLGVILVCLTGSSLNGKCGIEVVLQGDTSTCILVPGPYNLFYYCSGSCLGAVPEIRQDYCAECTLQPQYCHCVITNITKTVDFYRGTCGGITTRGTIGCSCAISGPKIESKQITMSMLDDTLTTRRCFTF